MLSTKKQTMPAKTNRQVTMSNRSGCCLFAAADLPSGTRLRFSVRPFECFGKAGKAISTDVRFTRTDTCALEPVDAESH